MVYGDAGRQAIEKRAEIADKRITFPDAMRRGTRRTLPIPRMDDYWIWLKLQAFIRAMIEQPFRIVNEQIE